MYNAEWFDALGNTIVTHLSGSCSDHAPLLIKALSTDSEYVKYFKFLNIWVDHEEYLEKVQQAWSKDFVGNPLYVLHQKIKKVISTLSAWSSQAFGDIYEEPKRLKVLISSLEETMLNNPSPEARMALSKARAEFTRFLKLQDSILRKKAMVKWLTDGDANTVFFHAVIKDKRIKLNIQRIRDESGNTMEGTEEVAGAAVDVFQNLFSAGTTIQDSSVLEVVRRTVTVEDNNFLTAAPTMDEVKNSLFMIDPDSAPGQTGSQTDSIKVHGLLLLWMSLML